MKKKQRKDRGRRKEVEAQWSKRRRSKRQSRKGEGQEGAKVRGAKGSVTRVRNRCVATGSARSRMRWFRRSRWTMREKARKGERLGRYKKSW